jgi:hypothetical protein
MRHLKPGLFPLPILFVLAVLGANAHAQRVFVGTSYPSLTVPTQMGQIAILSSVPVGDSMRTLKTFDVLAVGTVDCSQAFCGNYDLGVLICDKPDCSGQLQATVATSGGNETFNMPTSYLRVSGTFAQTNPGKPGAAVLMGYIYGYIGLNRLSQQSYNWALSGPDYGPAEDVTPPTQPIDLYSGNRYVAVALTCNPQGPCNNLAPQYGAATIKVFRVTLIP